MMERCRRMGLDIDLGGDDVLRWAVRRCWRRTGRGWRSGESDCSRAWRAMPAGRRGTSRFRRIAWWSWERRSSSERDSRHRRTGWHQIGTAPRFRGSNAETCADTAPQSGRRLLTQRARSAIMGHPAHRFARAQIRLRKAMQRTRILILRVIRRRSVVPTGRRRDRCPTHRESANRLTRGPAPPRSCIARSEYRSNQ